MFARMSTIRDVGTVIQVLRVTRGLSQGELAKRSGVRNSSISNYERGKAEPKFETLQKLAEGLGLPFAALEETQRFIDQIESRGELDAEGTGEPATEEDLSREATLLARDAGRVVERLVNLALRLLRGLETPP